MRAVPQALSRFIPFWLFVFFFKIAGAVHYTMFPVLAESVFPVWQVGLIVGGAAGLQMLMDVPAGYLLDRYGYTRLLAYSAAIFCVSAALFLFGVTPLVILASAFLAAFGWVFFNPGVNAYVLVQAQKAFAGRFMALRDMVSSSGTISAMILLPHLLEAPLHVMIGVICTGFLLAIAALAHAPRDTASLSETPKIAHQSWYIRRHFFHHALRAMTRLNPVSTALLLRQFCAATFYGVVWFVIPLMIERAVHAQVLSFGLVAFDVAVLVTGYGLGKLADRWNRRWMVFWGMFVFALFALLLGFHFGVLFIVFGFLATTGDEMAGISLWSWLDHLDKNHAEDGLVTGVLTLFEDFGWMVGPIMAGFLFSLVGPTWTIASAGGLVFLAWLICAILLHIPGKHQSVFGKRLQKTLHVPRRVPHKD